MMTWLAVLLGLGWIGLVVVLWRIRRALDRANGDRRSSDG